MRPDGGTVMSLPQPSPAILSADKRVPPTGIDQETRTIGFFVPAFIHGLNADTVGSTLDVDVRHLRLLSHHDSQSNRILQQEMVEFRTRYLKGQVARVIDDVVETPGG